MAVTVKIIKRDKTGRGFESIVDVVLDSSYPTGGEALSPRNCGLSVIEFVTANPSGGYIPQYDYVNKKLKMYMCEYDDVASGPMIEVSNTTDLSAITTRLLVKGY